MNAWATDVEVFDRYGEQFDWMEITDLEKGIVLWEFVEGIPFSDWIFSNPKKKDLESFLEELFLQAEKLDSAGLSHGQLAGSGKNILVSNNKPVIIDFEKASANRKCNNKNQLESFIYRSKDSSIVKKVKEILAK